MRQIKETEEHGDQSASNQPASNQPASSQNASSQNASSQNASSQNASSQHSSSERRTIEDEEDVGQESLRSLLEAASSLKKSRDVMYKETVDEQVHDASTQGRVVGNDGSPPVEISRNE
eukprot:3777128-Ditylum_brightwellii.AAC.1